MFAWGMGLFICTKPMAKRNQHAKQGFGVTNPEDAIHLGEDKFIRLESDLPESSEGDKRVGRRSYNDERYFRDALVNANNPSATNPFATIDDLPILDPTLPDGLLDGGIVQWKEVGYEYQVSSALIRELGIVDTVAGVDFTLTEAHPTLNRIDVPVVSLEFGFQVLIGTPAVDPIEPQPTGNQIRLTSIIVNAGSTVPEGITTTVVYKENLEFTVSHIGAGTSNPDNLLFPFEGLKSVNVTNVENGSTTLFTSATDLNRTEISSGSLRLRIKEPFSNGHNLQVRFLDASNIVVGSGTLTINKSSINEYQFVAFAMDGIVWSADTFRKIALVFVRTSNQVSRQGYYIDNFILQGGISQAPSTGLIKTAISITYGDLYNLYNNSSLVPGQYYLITDFQTIHLIPNTTDIHTGGIEPLLVLATDVDTIDSQVYSTVYPNDVIQLNFTNNLAEDGTTPRKGLITYRKDTIANNEVIGLDFREWRYRRYKILSKRSDVITNEFSNQVVMESTLVNVNHASTFFNSLRKFHVSIDSEITHDAGELNLRIWRGSFSYTKPLLKSDGTSIWSENELLGKKGMIVSCLTRNAFIFFYETTSLNIAIGEDIIGTYSSYVNNAIFNIGDQLSYNVDVNDFQDYKIFNESFNHTNNRLNRPNNVVFRNIAQHINMDAGCINYHLNDATYGVDFMGGPFATSTEGGMVVAGPLYWGRFHDVTRMYLNRGHSVYMTDYTLNTTVITVGWSDFIGFQTNGYVTDSTFITDLSKPVFQGTVSSSFISVFGQRIWRFDSGFLVSGHIRGSIIGRFNANGVVLSRSYLNNSEYDVDAYDTVLGFTKVKNTRTPVGEVKILGRDEDGNVVDGSDTLTSILQLENGIVSKGTVVQSGNDITLNTAWRWRIDNIEYQLASNTALTFPPAAAENQRIDVIVGNTSGGIQRIVGTEVDLETPLVAPTAPANTIPLVEVFILETGIDTFTQFALGTFVRYDVNNQNLSEIQRQNARTNIQAVSRDVSDNIYSELWQFRDKVKNASLFEIRHGSQGSERLMSVRLLNDSGTQEIRLFSGVPQAGLGNQFARFFLRGNGTGNRSLVSWNDGNLNPVFAMESSGVSQFYNHAPIQPRSSSATRAVRRDELPFNYPQTVTTAGTINDLELTNEGVKLLILTLADDLTGVVPVTTNTGRELKIEGRNPSGVIIRHDSASSTEANRFSFPGGFDLNILNGQVFTFIYTNGRWRLSNDSSSKYNESQLVSTLAPLKFDLDYQIGSPANPVSGDITFDLIGATMGSAVSVFHQSASAPTFGTNIDKALINFTLADYDTVGLNEFVFHYMEDPNNANDPYLKIYHTKNITVVSAI
jgi:hypothetical protein